LIGYLAGCNNNKNSEPAPQRAIVTTPEQMDKKIPDVIKESLSFALENMGKIDDSITITQPAVLNFLYKKKDWAAIWSKGETWTKATDSLMDFIENAKLYGLFPSDYHFGHLQSIRERFARDSSLNADRKDAVLWSKADVMLTDAFVQIVNDVKLGRLPKDSITLRTDSVLTNEFYEEQLNKLVQSFSITAVVSALEPQVKGYRQLKEGIKDFLDSAKFEDRTYVPYPVYDTVQFRKALQQRLFEENLVAAADSVIDTAQIREGIKKYQALRHLKVDGKAGGETIRALNLTDKDKFIRIAITLDKYKLLPAEMPAKYIWVNIPSYYLQLWESDSIRFTSRVCVGKPLTRTPELNSSVSEMITYPQWTIPQSIIAKDILPALKKSPGYLAKKGFSLLNGKNEEVDPYFVDWSLYKTGIPYRVIQGSGDANALGIMKFNFPNKYAVYLHDTNQRYLFGQAARALSHGCVRVQEWEKLAKYIINNDSIQAKVKGSSSFTRTDSVYTWLKKKEKHVVPVRNRIAVFIRYFTCEAKDGKVVFYDDIYNEDHRLRERYFANK
jgi:murein L,D-transpeptidase YcbB/YkuD